MRIVYESTYFLYLKTIQNKKKRMSKRQMILYSPLLAEWLESRVRPLAQTVGKYINTNKSFLIDKH